MQSGKYVYRVIGSSPGSSNLKISSVTRFLGKVAKFVPKVAQKAATADLLKSDVFKSVSEVAKYLGYFCTKKSVTKTSKNEPNLVTLLLAR